MPHDRGEFVFWRSVGARFLLVLLLGGASILWFQGCLVPMASDEMRQNQQKAAEGADPPR